MAEESERRESREHRVIAKPPVHVGRRTVLGILGLTGIGIAAGAKIDSVLGSSLSAVSSAIGVPLPGASNFRYYTITGSYPVIAADTYELAVDGMVDTPVRLSLADLRSMPRKKLVHRFQCVTGWYVPNVHWEGVLLSDVLQRAGVSSRATAIRLFSADGAYTESLTLAQAHLPDIIVADLMQSANLTSEHGGPVRLYVAPMYGYKSIKWLNRIEVTNEIVPGYWEDNGYPVDAWINGVAEK
jgi:DMSO/TMAO reductase YedYZ molybdopterin-dependent catalytic subunit